MVGRQRKKGGGVESQNVAMKPYGVTVLDRDGGEIFVSEWEFETYEEADQAGKFYMDHPAYGSHYVEEK